MVELGSTQLRLIQVELSSCHVGSIRGELGLTRLSLGQVGSDGIKSMLS